MIGDGVAGSAEVMGALQVYRGVWFEMLQILESPPKG